jgi:hypothetical protein
MDRGFSSIAVENITNLLPVALFSAGVIHNEIRYYMEENLSGTPIVCDSVTSHLVYP